MISSMHAVSFWFRPWHRIARCVAGSSRPISLFRFRKNCSSTCTVRSLAFLSTFCRSVGQLFPQPSHRTFYRGTDSWHRPGKKYCSCVLDLWRHWYYCTCRKPLDKNFLWVCLSNPSCNGSPRLFQPNCIFCLCIEIKDRPGKRHSSCSCLVASYETCGSPKRIWILLLERFALHPRIYCRHPIHRYSKCRLCTSRIR